MSNRKDQIVSFVFNSPMLVPWKVVEDAEDLDEAMLLWQESKDDGFRFKENDAVADVSNPRQKMIIRRIIREQYKQGNELKSRLKGIECYWWQSSNVDEVLKNLMTVVSDRTRVPGSVKVE